MKRILFVIILITIAFLIIGLMPVKRSKENAIVIVGKVKSVSEGGVKDLVFELENNSTAYYINRGLENGFELEDAKRQFTGKNITLFYADSWTPLAPFGTTSKHISHAIVNDTVVYNEWESFQKHIIPKTQQR
ncbi:hypothetical protein [Flavobacterium sp.]|uniref:hypothetical protein n=1 Tax=Flavobacterium sp. TaxID=239 RepID=UPI002FDD7796